MCGCFSENYPDEADPPIVISDPLEGQLHEDIMSVVDSPEGQESHNILEVFFSEEEQLMEVILLETLHTTRNSGKKVS